MGSAGNDKDIPIPIEYKFSKIDRNSLIKIENLIQRIFLNYESETIRFNKYRDSIRNEKAEFNKNCEEIFCKIKLKLEHYYEPN